MINLYPLYIQFYKTYLHEILLPKYTTSKINIYLSLSVFVLFIEYNFGFSFRLTGLHENLLDYD